MTQKEIHESLDGMLSNPKSKNFLNHLIRAYFPITNVDKVWQKPEGQFKCVITKDELFSAQDILEGIRTEEFQNDFMNNLKSVFTENFDNSHPFVKLIGERKMGVTGRETNTFMSYPAMQEFYNWVLTKSLTGDKHINWLLSSIRKEESVEPVQTKKSNNNKNTTNNTGSFTLGELDSFKKLKEKFKN